MEKTKTEVDKTKGGKSKANCEKQNKTQNRDERTKMGT